MIFPSIATPTMSYSGCMFPPDIENDEWVTPGVALNVGWLTTIPRDTLFVQRASVVRPVLMVDALYERARFGYPERA